MNLANWLASMMSSGLTRNAHSLTDLPISSRIFGLLHASMIIGTCSSFTIGSAPRHAPLWVWPMITSTLSTSTSLRTALTASPGVPALSPKYASILRPAMPPLVLYSSTSIWAAHFTPSPVIADGPVIADENPTLIGGLPCAPARGRSPPTSRTVATATASTPRRIRVIAFSFCFPATGRGDSAEDRQLLARLSQLPHAGGGDLHGVLDLDAAPAVLVVGRLHAEDHARLERHAGRGVDGRRVVRLEPDPVADVVALVVRHPVGAGDAHRGLEDLVHGHAGLHGRDGGLLSVAGGVVVAELLLGRCAEHRGPRDIRAIALVHAAQVEADQVAGLERGVRRVDVGEGGAMAHRDDGKEGLGASADDFSLEHHRGLALGDARLEHAEDRRDAVLRDQGGALEPPHLLRALDRPRSPEVRVGGHDRRPAELLAQSLPGGGEHAGLVEADTAAEGA